MKIRLDEAACSGHGRCYILAPEVFGEDERGHCVIKHEDVPEALQESAKTGVDNCPEQALIIEK
jgi:ferredoxin